MFGKGTRRCHGKVLDRRLLLHKVLGLDIGTRRGRGVGILFPLPPSF